MPACIIKQSQQGRRKSRRGWGGRKQPLSSPNGPTITTPPPLSLSFHYSLRTCASYSFVSSSFSSSSYPFSFSSSSGGRGEKRMRGWSLSRMLYPVGAASTARSCGEQMAQDQYNQFVNSK